MWAIKTLRLIRTHPYPVRTNTILARSRRERRRRERDARSFVAKWKEEMEKLKPKDVIHHKVTSLQVLAAKQIVAKGSVFFARLEKAKVLSKTCMQIVWDAALERPKCQLKCCYRD